MEIIHKEDLCKKLDDCLDSLKETMRDQIMNSDNPTFIVENLDDGSVKLAIKDGKKKLIAIRKHY